MEQLLNSNNESFDQGADGGNSRQGGGSRKRAITGHSSGLYRGADGKMYQRGQTVRISQTTE